MSRNHPLLLLLLSSQLALTGLNAGVVTTSPEHEDRKIVVAKDESVTFTATPDSGDVTTTLTVDPSGPTISGSGSSQTATFAAGTEGQAYTCTLSVTHTDGDVTCTDGQQFTYTVYVPKITGVGNGDDIWFFDDGQGDATYPVKRTISVAAVPSGKTMTWKLRGQSDVVNFANNQETIVGTDTQREVHTVGYSQSQDNMFLELEIDGKIVATTDGSKFTARAPIKITESISDAAMSNGWRSTFTYVLKDKFGQLMPNVSVCEVFGSPNSWPQDYPGTNWNLTPANYGNGNTDSSSQFYDNYSYATQSGDVPSSVNPGATGTGTRVIHNSQKYKIGGTGSPGVSATGFVTYDTNLQFCRGRAYHY